MKILRRHLLGLGDLTPAQIEAMLDLAAQARSGALASNSLSGKTVVNLFYEPSTRTRTSFGLAAGRLSASVVDFDVETSSAQKGESLVDTVRTLEAMGVDLIVIRHGSAGAPALAANHVRCSIVNAGDGMHEHPTQGLLDLLTLREAKGRILGLRVAMLGDIVHSRVARSTLHGLVALGAEVVLCGPPTLLPPAFAGPAVRTTHRIEEALEGADAIMALRMQLERAAGGFVPSLGEFGRLYALDAHRLRLAKPDAVILHPGPMNLGVEIVPEVAYGGQSLVLRQVAHGVAVRMAVLYDLLSPRAELLSSKPIGKRPVGLS
jgi:aspartate carbamoyltransferase catalytic subunit